MNEIKFYDLSKYNELLLLKNEVTKLSVIKQKEFVNFILNESPKFDYTIVDVECEVLGDFDFNFMLDGDCILWVSIGSLSITIIFFREYYKDMEHMFYPIEEDDFYIFLCRIFAGDYRTEQFFSSDNELIYSTLYIGKMSHSDEYYNKKIPVERKEIINGKSFYKK